MHIRPNQAVCDGVLEIFSHASDMLFSPRVGRNLDLLANALVFAGEFREIEVQPGNCWRISIKREKSRKSQRKHPVARRQAATIDVGGQRILNFILSRS